MQPNRIATTKGSSFSVLKFGGTSMGTSESIGRCVSIIQEAAKKERILVVVSALGGVTDQLIALTDVARQGETSEVLAGMKKIQSRHRETLTAFVKEESLLEEIWIETFQPLFQKLQTILVGSSFVGDMTKQSYATICSFGERLSSRLLSEALKQAGIASEAVDATEVVRTDSNFLEATVFLEETQKLCEKKLLPLLQKKIIPVVTGFIGEDNDENLTLLGRGGSDYTASLMAISLNAERVEIWTDVDGILSADPRVIQNVRVWRSIEMPVMAEMSYSGAKVLHPKTIIAAVRNNIPVVIKNTFNAQAEGTRVLTENECSTEQQIRGIVVAKAQVLYHLCDMTMLQAVGFMERCIGVFTSYGIPLDVCSTSEVSFSLSIAERDDRPELLADLQKVARTSVINHLAKVNIIGQSIGSDAHLLSVIFGVLSPYEIHATSISASHHTISLLVHEKDADDILKLLHHTIFEQEGFSA